MSAQPTDAGVTPKLGIAGCCLVRAALGFKGMPRKLRLEYAGACYHVINRGNYRRDLFAGRGAAKAFVACLFEACCAFAWRLHAFIVMRNHFHLAVETPEPNLSDGMKWLQGTWAIRFNRFRGESGRPFQGRYKALHVEPGHALAQVAHYIHLNPVRADILTPTRIREYEWSSLYWFTQPQRPTSLEPSTILSESGGLTDSPEGWQRYIAYLLLLAEEEANEREERFGRLSEGWAIGSSEFVARLRGELTAHVDSAERFELLGSDRTAQMEARGALWTQQLARFAQAFGIDLEQLPLPKSAYPKVCLATAMKVRTSVSNRWLAERLQMGKSTSVAALIRRFRLEGYAASEEFRTALSRFTT